MADGGSTSDCHLCHIHDHAPASTLLRTHPLRASHSRSRNPSKSSATTLHRNHHHHHHHDGGHHSRDNVSLRDTDARTARVASALAKLSERSHSLPGSHTSSISRTNEVSILPNGSPHEPVHRGGDVHSLSRSQREYNNVIAALLETRAGSLPSSHSPSHREPDLLNALPRTRNNSRASTLTRGHLHHSNLTLAQDTEQDYYTHINRARYKDEARKQRFNIQTVMLIGCYTMLFVVAIIVGVVLCQQNGWLGFGSSHESSGDLSRLPTNGDPGSSSMRDLGRRTRGKENRGNRPGPTVDYDYQDDSSSRVNIAGVFPGDRGKSNTPTNIRNTGRDDPLRTTNFQPTGPINNRNNRRKPNQRPPSPVGTGSPVGDGSAQNRFGQGDNGNALGSGKSIIDSTDQSQNNGFQNTGVNDANLNSNGGHSRNNNPFNNFGSLGGVGSGNSATLGRPNGQNIQGNSNREIGGINSNRDPAQNLNPSRNSNNGNNRNFNGAAGSNNRNQGNGGLSQGNQRNQQTGDSRSNQNHNFEAGLGFRGNGPDGSFPTGSSSAAGNLNTGNFNSGSNVNGGGSFSGSSLGSIGGDSFGSGSSGSNGRESFNGGGTSSSNTGIFTHGSSGSNGRGGFDEGSSSSNGRGNLDGGSGFSRGGNLNAGSGAAVNFGNGASSNTPGNSPAGSRGTSSNNRDQTLPGGNFNAGPVTGVSTTFGNVGSTRPDETIHGSEIRGVQQNNGGMKATNFGVGSNHEMRNFEQSRPGTSGSSGNFNTRNLNNAGGAGTITNFNAGSTSHRDATNQGSDSTTFAVPGNVNSATGIQGTPFNNDQISGSGTRRPANFGIGSSVSGVGSGTRGSSNFGNSGSGSVSGIGSGTRGSTSFGNSGSGSASGIGSGTRGSTSFGNSGSVSGVGSGTRGSTSFGNSGSVSGVGSGTRGSSNLGNSGSVSGVGSGTRGSSNFGNSGSVSGVSTFNAGSNTGGLTNSNNRGNTGINGNFNPGMGTGSRNNAPGPNSGASVLGALNNFSILGITTRGQGTQSTGNAGNNRNLNTGSINQGSQSTQNSFGLGGVPANNRGANLGQVHVNTGTSNVNLGTGNRNTGSINSGKTNDQLDFHSEVFGIDRLPTPIPPMRDLGNGDRRRMPSGRKLNFDNIPINANTNEQTGNNDQNIKRVGENGNIKPSSQGTSTVNTKPSNSNGQPISENWDGQAHKGKASIAGNGASGAGITNSNLPATPGMRGTVTIPPIHGNTTPLKVMKGFTVQRGEVVAMSTIKSSDQDISILQPDHDVLIHITPNAPDAGVSLIRRPGQDPNMMEAMEGVLNTRPLTRGGAASPVLRRWEHTDGDGTLSRGLVRKDGSFAFTNCRPSEVCGPNSGSTNS